MRRPALITICAVIGAISTPQLRAQQIVDEALQIFPTEINRLEYLNPAQLRGLPNYPSLKERYLGKYLLDILRSLTTFGVEESDVDEVVLGWEIPGAGENAGSGSIWGLAGGRFRADQVSAGAAAQGLKPFPVGDLEAYCLGSNGGKTCVAQLDDGRGAFGTLEQLSFMIAARDGTKPGLSSNSSFTDLVSRDRPNTPIWGVAKGPAVADWFQGSMPNQEGADFKWSQLLAGVEALTYSVDVGDRANVEIGFGCKSAAAATELRQLLDALRLFQQIAWQKRNSTSPNPFDHVEVSSSGDQVKLSLATPVPGAGEIE